MTGGRNMFIVTKAVWLLLATMVVYANVVFAVEPGVPSSVDVYWMSTRVPNQT